MSVDMAPVLQMDSVSFSYPGSVSALKFDSVELQHGEHLFVQGPSGAGKTTFLSLLTGILIPTSGRICILGQDLMQLSPRQRDAWRGRYQAYMFQQFNLIPHLSVRDNILLPLWMQGIQDSSKNRELLELADLLSIEDLLLRQAGKLSVGQQQRVAAARCFIHHPPMIVADEPTSALDPLQKQTLIELMFRLASRHKSTLIVVSHDHELASRFSRRIKLGSSSNKAQIHGDDSNALAFSKEP